MCVGVCVCAVGLKLQTHRLGSLIPSRLLGGMVNNEPVIADVSNVPMRSGSFHGWDELFPLLAHSFSIVLIEEDIRSCQVIGSFQNSYLVLEPQELDHYRPGTVTWASGGVSSPVGALHLNLPSSVSPRSFPSLCPQTLSRSRVEILQFRPQPCCSSSIGRISDFSHYHGFTYRTDVLLMT